LVAGQPGLYFVGLHFLYSLSSTMIHGVARDAERIARAIASRRTTGAPHAAVRGGALTRQPAEANAARPPPATTAPRSGSPTRRRGAAAAGTRVVRLAFLASRRFVDHEIAARGLDARLEPLDRLLDRGHVVVRVVVTHVDTAREKTSRDVAHHTIALGRRRSCAAAAVVEHRITSECTNDRPRSRRDPCRPHFRCRVHSSCASALAASPLRS
jgi:hypothetical protein